MILEHPERNKDLIEQSSYAYLLESNGYYTPKFIYKLLNAGVRVKVGLKPFSIDGNFYDYGSIMIPVANPAIWILKALVWTEIRDASSGLNVGYQKSVSTGLTEGIDLGSQ